MQSRRLLLASALAACATEPMMPADTIYEFRDYTLHPGQRDVLVELFEREFIEPQEAVGAHVRATFRDFDDPDRFVWIRSFADAQSRYAALDGFYTGLVWQAHRTAANATIVDSDNVLQLRPLSGAIASTARPPLGAADVSNAMILATIHYPNDEAAFHARFASETEPRLRELNAAPFAAFATEHAPNVYPRLPVREDTVFLTLTRFNSPEAYADMCDALTDIERTLGPLCAAPSEKRRLQATARSTLR